MSNNPDGTADSPTDPTDPTDPIDPTTVDLSGYDLERLRADVMELFDLQAAIGETVMWSLRGVAVAGLLAWWAGRGMPVWALVPFVLIAVVLAFLAVTVASVYLVVRKRVENAVVTSERVLETVVLIRDDLYHVSEGRKQVSTRDLASDVLEDVVFPVMAETAVSVLPGPLRLLARPIVWLPRRLIGRTVGAAIDHLPDERLDRDVVIDNRALIRADVEIERAAGNRAAVLAVHDAVETIVVGVIRALWWPTLALTALASIPLIVWLVVGWLAG